MISRIFFFLFLNFLPFLVYRKVEFLVLPLIYLLIQFKSDLCYRELQKNKNFFKFQWNVLNFRLSITYFFVLFTLIFIPMLYFSDSKRLDWAMSVGWDLIGHYTLFSFQSRYHFALDQAHQYQYYDTFSYMMPGYPNLWHFFWGNISSVFFETFSLNSFRFFTIASQFTVILSSVILFFALLRLVKFDSIKRFGYKILILTLLLVYTLHYTGIWTFVGWVNWPIAVSLFFLGLSFMFEDPVRTKSQGSVRKEFIVLYFLPLLYPSIYVLFLLYVLISIIYYYLTIRIVTLKKYRSTTFYMLSKMELIFVVNSFLIFLFLFRVTPKGMLLDDGGGVRIRLSHYLILLIICLFLFSYSILKKKVNLNLFIYVAIYTPFVLCLTFLTLRYGRQPYGFSKLGTVFFALGIIIIIMFCLQLFNNKFYTLSKTSKTKGSRIGLSSNYYIIFVCIIPLSLFLLSKINPIYASKHTNLFLNNFIAVQEPILILDQNWYTGKDILGIPNLGYENRSLNKDIVLFTGKYPYLANMWLSLFRPNDAPRAWGPPIVWLNKPLKHYNYINYFSEFVTTDQIQLGLENDSHLILYSKIDKCTDVKDNLPLVLQNRFNCL